jgi:hypothetical protein
MQGSRCTTNSDWKRGNQLRIRNFGREKISHAETRRRRGWKKRLVERGGKIIV